MKDYQPTKEDIKIAKEIYDNVIFKQVYDPNQIREAFKRLYGYNALNQIHAKNMIAAYFQYHFKPEMITDHTDTTEITTPSIVIDNPTHTEGIISAGIIGEIELIIEETENLLNKVDENQTVDEIDETQIISKPKRKSKTK